ncbi:hypothetical protein JD844_021942 [Phrynosoma platyrhinos]|uniref:VWFD domain-containing protein n=1 Tax=Phrynosoma platyrhinos TaxID=52577 RepID=A0ABQ7SUH7_PHRPL|nr:hypothetical protein JD844_021942 [Phrynosoma platyrhinos]
MYKGKTCGLCGDYDGNGKNDLLLHGYKSFPWQFGNLQKVENPTKKCPDVPGDSGKQRDNSHQRDKCKNRYKSKCKKALSRFGNCAKVIDMNDYLSICIDDMCDCSKKSSHSDLVASCVCSTLSQYARDCVLKGGDPGKWRSKELCYQQCPHNLQYMECGNPCVDTCFNPERSKICKAPCTDGCFCPEGENVTWDMIHHFNGTLIMYMCFEQGQYLMTSMTKNVFLLATVHAPIKAKSILPVKPIPSPARTGTVISLLRILYQIEKASNWYFVNVNKRADLPLRLEVTEDRNTSCPFLQGLPEVIFSLIFQDTDGSFVVIGEIAQCGISNTTTCLKNTLITLGAINIKICSCGDVYINNIIGALPVTKDGVTVFRPSTFYVNIVTSSRVQIQVQLKPIMQIFITVDETYQNRTSGTLEYSLVFFLLEKFGQHWCALLLNANGIFAECHSVSDPAPYAKTRTFSLLPFFCFYFLCKDVSMECPRTMQYSYEVKFCNRSCRSLREPDMLCNIQIVSVEGCECPEGTYLANENECVSPEDCPCYYEGQLIQPGNSFQKDGLICKCIQGQLDCIENTEIKKGCPSPMYYFDCGSAGPHATGSECQKSCKTQDMQCYATECASGCMCPDGLVSSGNGSCIEEDQCPCIYGGNFYSPGKYITVNCNKCTCQRRQWICTKNPCQGVCTVYGNGHYFNFDGTKFDFMGDCDYILAQDFCPNNIQTGTFRIIVQNIACGKSLSVCSLKISILLEGSEIRLLGEKIEETTNKPDTEKNYTIYLMGIYIIIETYNGMIFIWDQKTTVTVLVAPSFQGKICGLCGDFDSSANNDFTTRGQSVEMDAQAFGNSWKVTSSCSDINKIDLCVNQPSRLVLGRKYCSVIKSEAFGSCHSKINPTPYYESCVSDFCGCDNVADCECFCTAVAAYSKSCSRAGICIDWRSPTNCRKYSQNKSALSSIDHRLHDKCMKIKIICHFALILGCYPECNAEKPYYDEEKRECVSVLECTSCDPKEKLCLNKTNGKLAMSSTISPAKQETSVFPCFCNINGQLITNGNSQLVTRDTTGWCIYAFCNTTCQTEFNFGECVSFATTAVPSKHVMIPSRPCKGNIQMCEKQPPPYSPGNVVPAFIPGSDCTDLDPPRKVSKLHYQ